MKGDALYDEIEDYISRLTDKQKMRFVCRFFLRLSPEEIARLESISRQAVWVSISQIRHNIRKYQTYDELSAALIEIFSDRLH